MEEVLPYFDTADSKAAAGAVRMLALMTPMEPAPEASLDCQPCRLIPTHFYLFARLFRTQAATTALVGLFSTLAKTHLVCQQVSFGAYGIFDEIQSREIFAAISRLTRIDDKNSDDSFDSRFFLLRDRTQAAEQTAEWIVFSLSPLCLEQKTSMLSGLESFIASITVMYYPNSRIQAQLAFVTELLWYLAHRFCWRYNKEQSGELATPPGRQINDELRRAFVCLLRNPVHSGCFSLHEPTRTNCRNAAKPLADLEPGLIVPTVLQRFYAIHDSQVDGDAVEYSMWLLVALCSTIAREKGLRCYLPNLMNLALPGINANRPALTTASCQFIRLAICDPPPIHLRCAEPGKSDGPKAAQDWIANEIKGLNKGGSIVDVDYREKLSDEKEIFLLRSAFSDVDDFVLRFMQCVFKFGSDVFRRSDIDTDLINERSMAEQDVRNTVEACFMSLQPEILGEATSLLSKRLASDPISQAKELIGCLVHSVSQANPKRELQIVVPMLLDYVQRKSRNVGLNRDPNVMT